MAQETDDGVTVNLGDGAELVIEDVTLDGWIDLSVAFADGYMFIA